MLLYNWSLILLSSGKLLKASKLSGVKRWIGLILVGAAVIGTVFHPLSRPGFFISLLIIAVIAISDWIVMKVRKKKGTESNNKKSPSLEVRPVFRITGITRMRKGKI
ncbi:hypothetical protein D3C78_1355130 [compost metagenome]